MTIRALCPHCEAELAFEDRQENAEATCQSCGGGLRVPRRIRYTCRKCDHQYLSGPQHAGRRFTCRKCSARVTVPERWVPQTPSVDTQRHVDDDFADETGDDWFDQDPDDQPTAPKPMETPARRGARPGGYAGFWRRVGAMLVDGLILSMAATVLIGGLMAALSFATQDESLIGLALLGANVLSNIGFLAYFTLFESGARQGTPGKRLLGIMVTDLDGQPVSMGRAALRNLAKIISGLICMIGYLMVPFTKRKQGLHDIIAGCLVVRAE